MIKDQARRGSTPAETYRGTMTGRTPTGEDATVIITRQGLDDEARVWLTFCGAIKITVVMTDQDTAELRKLLGEATSRTGRPRG